MLGDLGKYEAAAELAKAESDYFSPTSDPTAAKQKK